jgi:3alpha(or 20beta)-hydroxysteroid dehydrogenase
MARHDDRVVLISGAAKGQGAAAARLLVAEGARVALGDVLVDEGKRLADELGDNAVFVELDVRDEQSWADAVSYTVSTWGRLDCLVNNAGVMTGGTVTELSLADHDEMIAVNQRGVLLGMRAAIPALREGGVNPNIVNIASIDGLIGIKQSSAYCASKFAVVGMTRAVAAEVGQFGIRVNAICPGVIETDMTNFLPPPVADWLGKQMPLGRLGKPEETATLVSFLASDEASYCTGSSFVVDGGWTASQLTL